MDKIRIGDIVRFSYNTTPRIYLIVNNRGDINMKAQCVVEDITDGNAVIHAQSDEEARLVIPTKYLIKVEAEAKEEPSIGRINFAEREKRQQEAHQSIVNELRDKSFDWDAYTANLAKEIVLKIACSQLHNHKPQEIGRMAVEIAKSVVENLKESED